jgi:8-oxo-(d)GTP phosphatase
MTDRHARSVTRWTSADVRLTAVDGTPPAQGPVDGAAQGPVLAAGAVVWRRAEPARNTGEVQVLLVHRPKYDDWSFPKGKLDPGEHVLVATGREVAEETGLPVRLGPPLPEQEYAAAAGVPKRVRYWAARPLGDASVDAFEPNSEVDDVAWLRLGDARRRLTYARDIDVLDAFAVSAYRSEPLIVLRHSHALPRDSWTGPDRQRGLDRAGEEQARVLAPLLRAYGVRRVLSSDAVRCTATVEPYAAADGRQVEVDHRLSEEGAEPGAVAKRVETLLRSDEATVLCSHRPVLPALFSALGVPDPALAPGAFVVVHREGARVRASEHHHP